MHNFVYLAQRRSQEFSCRPNFRGGACRHPGCATATDPVDVQSPCVRFSATYSGPHGFEVSVQKQPKETKSATWTVNTCIINNRLCSPISHKLLVAYTRGFSCGIWRRKAHATLQYRPYTCAYQYMTVIFYLFYFRFISVMRGGSVAEWLVCRTQAQKARVQIAVATLSGNSHSHSKLFTPFVPLFTKQQNW